MKPAISASVKTIAFNVLAIILGLFFAFAGARKLFTDWPEAKRSYLQYHPLWVYYASGVVELIFGLGMAFPKTRFVSCIFILVMIVLVAAHPWEGGQAKFLIPAVVSTALLVMVAWLSRPR